MQHLIESNEPKIEQTELSETLHFQAGKYHGEVHAVYGDKVLPAHTDAIREARSHYSVWGEVTENFLWNARDAISTTKHYWCTVVHTDHPTFSKSFYFRKTLCTLREPLQPDEVQFWLTTGQTGQQSVHSLLLDTHGPDASFSVLARASTITQGTIPQEAQYLHRNLSSLACAGALYFANQQNETTTQPFWLLMVQPELPKQVLAFSQGEKQAKLAFNSIARWPGYAETQSNFFLDISNPSVIAYKTLAPGYWMQRERFPHLLQAEFAAGTLTLSNPQLLHIAQRYAIPTDTIDVFCSSFASQKHARALADLFVVFPAIASRITSQGGDGPYLVKVTPQDLAHSAEYMLQVAAEKET